MEHGVRAVRSLVISSRDSHQPAGPVRTRRVRRTGGDVANLPVSTAEVLDALVEGVMVVDHEGRLRYVNAAAAALYGIERDELVGTFLDDPRWRRLARDGEEVPDGDSITLRTIRDGVERSDVEVGLRRADGAVVWLLMSTRLLRADHSSTGSAVVLLRDVTDDRLVYQHGRLSERRFRTLAASSPFTIFELDAAGRVVFVSERWTELTGIPSAEVVGRSGLRLLPPEDRGRALAMYLASEECPHLHLRHRIVRADGRTIVVLTSIRPLVEGDRVVGYLGSISDMTEHERVEAELRVREAELVRLAADTERERLDRRLAEAERLAQIGELGAGLAHDFSNLLGVIQNLAGALERTSTVPAPVLDDVRRIREAADAGQKLTRRLLSLGTSDRHPHAFALAPVVEEFGVVLTKAVGPAVTIVVDVAPGGVRVVADPDEIRRLLLNLALNARDAMPEGGTITIAARPELPTDGRRLVRLSVTDTGVGMPAAVLQQSLEPFFTTKPKGTSSGLGLPTVGRIVREAGGSLHIASTPGHGTEVVVLLPAAEE